MIPLVTHRCPSKNSRNGCSGASDSQSRTNRMQDNRSGALVVLFMVVGSRCLIRSVMPTMMLVTGRGEAVSFPLRVGQQLPVGEDVADQCAFWVAHVLLQAGQHPNSATVPVCGVSQLAAVLHEFIVHEIASWISHGGADVRHKAQQGSGLNADRVGVLLGFNAFLRGHRESLFAFTLHLRSRLAKVRYQTRS